MIGLGEDGPTHQPVEHLAALRAIPNLLVFRPGDAVETAEAWQCALAAHDRPSVLALSRQGLEQFRHGDMTDNLTAKGAYVAAEADGARQATIMATGSEVGIALAARQALAADGIDAAVVSAPCLELFAEQDAGARAAVLGDAPRIAVEAASGSPGTGFFVTATPLSAWTASAPLARQAISMRISGSPPTPSPRGHAR